MDLDLKWLDYQGACPASIVYFNTLGDHEEGAVIESLYNDEHWAWTIWLITHLIEDDTDWSNFTGTYYGDSSLTKTQLFENCINGFGEENTEDNSIYLFDTSKIDTLKTNYYTWTA